MIRGLFRGSLGYLGRAHERFDNFSDAARLRADAAELAAETQSAIHHFGAAARCYYRVRNLPKVDAMIRGIREKAREAGAESTAMATLAAVFEETGSKTFALAVRERMAEIVPDASNDRFTLAYNHSQAGDNELAMYHYTRIPTKQRTEMAHNNLGVAYNHANLKCLAVEAFRASKQMDGTLAVSNLANQQLDAGFAKEARLECEAALKMPNYHKNVSATLTRIDETHEEESAKSDEIIKRTRPKSEFLRRFGKATTYPFPISTSSTWVHPTYGSLDLTISSGKLKASGSFRRTGAANALLFPGTSTSSTERTVLVTIIGIIIGAAAECQLTLDDGAPRAATLLGMIDNSHAVLMYCEADGSAWHLVEYPFSANPNFTTLRPPPIR